MASNDADLEGMANLMQAIAARPTLAKYDGSTSIESFLTELDLVYKELGSNDLITLRVLRQALDGEAKLFFTQLAKEDAEKDITSDVADWTERLRKRFKKTYQMQYTELKSRKMRNTDTASKYVDTVVGLARSLDPPMVGMQLLMLLHENILPKYKQSMRTMYPQSADEFKEKLGFLMMTTAGDDEEAVDKLADAISKVTAAVAAKTSAKTETTATTLAVQTYGQNPEQREDRNQRDYQRHDNSYRGHGGRGNGFRGRGRGRGRGYWQQQNYQPRSNFQQQNWQNWYQPSYGYQNQPFQYNPRPNWQPNFPFRSGYQSWQQQPQQWQPRAQYPQTQTAQRGQSSFRPVQGPQQAYMIEQPATCPATPATESNPSAGESEMASFFAPFPENQ